MSYSRTNIIRHLERYIEEVNVKKCHFGERKPVPTIANQSMPFPRLIMPLKGITRIAFAHEGKSKEAELLPGEVLFLGPFCWSSAFWTAGQEMLSIVFIDDRLLRVIYLKRDSDGMWSKKEEGGEPNDYYHIEDSVSKCTISVIHAMEHYQPKKQKAITGVRLSECLIGSTLSDLYHSQEICAGKSLQTWHKISHYLQENFSRPIDRKKVAKRFHISSSHLSHLFQRFSNENFTSYLNNLRLINSKYLLQESDMGLGEISWACGYQSVSYFIRMFKKAYGITPSIFRQKYNSKDFQN